ncbi:MAG: hypothetical protein HYY05_02920 [Chloroflexi bacterium]|nr:hypothetical protein [Chloroflexota bacterium]
MQAYERKVRGVGVVLCWLGLGVGVACWQAAGPGFTPPLGQAHTPAAAAAVGSHDVELEVRQRYRPDGDGFALDSTEFVVVAPGRDRVDLIVLSQGEHPIGAIPRGSGVLTITDYVSPGLVVDRLSFGGATDGLYRLSWPATGLPEGVATDPYRSTYVVAAGDGTVTSTVTWRHEGRLSTTDDDGIHLGLDAATVASAFAADETPRMGVALFNAGSQRRSIRLTCTMLRHGAGDEESACAGGPDQTREIRVAPLERVSFEWPLALLGYGKWDVRVRGEEAGETGAEVSGAGKPPRWLSSASVARYPSRVDRPDAERSQFGVNWAFKRALPLLARAGIRWERRIFVLWDTLAGTGVEKRWLYSDAYERAASAHGIGLLGYFEAYDERWKGGVPPADEFGPLVGEGVGRYGGSVRYWELWNEPDNPIFFRGGVGDYLLLHQRGAAAARQADPSARVLMAGLGEWGAGQFADRFLEQGGGRETDVASLHVYALPRPPEEDFRKRIQQSQRLLQRYGVARPLWITEMCWSTHPDFAPGSYWVTEEEQAQFLARAVVVALAEGVEKVFWFAFADGPGGRSDYYPANGCGLVDWEGFARPALVAYANLSWHLEGADYVGRLPLGDEALHAHLFRRGDEGVAVVWSVRVPRLVTLPLQPGGGEARDLYGNPIPYERTPDGVRLLAGGGPAYFTFGF